MTQKNITRAWSLLMALSLTSTAMAMLISNDTYVTYGAVLVLLAAWLKARIILGTYLELNHAPFWRRGFTAALTVFVLAAAALYLIG